ncbi:MAG: prepilin-type N-terminal cleavage/methylation domain-containing protein [Planctomycetes bacterium]|nr:prepilin-type N-terminal cleavage/methylation domain-containing protein [Planctomycetota bacterium]
MERTARRGFTLIELMIVISIIAVLASLVVVGVSKARMRAMEVEVRSTISSLDTALKQYDSDKGILPGYDDPPTQYSNSLPKILAALIGDGSRTPYLEFKESQIFVEREGDVKGFREANRSEIYDPNVNKYLIDPWGEPFIARENKSKKKKEAWMKLPYFVDIYSKGPNREDDTALGKAAGESDDIGNW